MNQQAEKYHQQRLVEAFYRATLFLLERIEKDHWRWSSNYLREHVRCATGLSFSNSDSPTILRALRTAHPDIAQWIDIGKLKDE